MRVTACSGVSGAFGSARHSNGTNYKHATAGRGKMGGRVRGMWKAFGRGVGPGEDGSRASKGERAVCRQVHAWHAQRQVPVMHMRAHHKACSMTLLNTGQHGSCQAVPSHHFQ